MTPRMTLTPETIRMRLAMNGPKWVQRLAKPRPFRPEFQDLKLTIHNKLLDLIELEALSSLEPDSERCELRTLVECMVNEEECSFTSADKAELVEEVLDEVFGLGPLEPLLQDPGVSDILVTTPQLVYIERGGKLTLTQAQFKDDRHLMWVIEKIVSQVGRRIDDTSPLVDARLPDGSRVNAVVPPVGVDGALLSIRRFRTDRVQAPDLLENFTLTEKMLEFLKGCVQARLNIVISGGTGAGKTTLLNILSGYISEDERIVTIEDAAELQLRQRHVARMEARPPNVEGKNAVTIRQLVVNALRMRPDRIIVGECRAGEALDMLQAMNTGHDGSMTTVHANSPRDALSRLEVMVGMASMNLPAKAVRQQIASAIDMVVQIARLSDGSRRVISITEIVGMEGELITTQEIFKFEKTGLTEAGVSGFFTAGGIRPKCSEKIQTSGGHVPPELFSHRVQIN